MTILQGACIANDPDLEITIIQDRARTAYQNQRPSQHPECTFYDSSFTKQLQTAQELNNLFDNSISNYDFKLYLQPKVWLDTGEERQDMPARFLHV